MAAPKKSIESFEVVDITPAMAQAWLEDDVNINNRPVAQRRVEAFARTMRAGLWKVNNQAIGFDVEGHLVDGQHRLWAVTEAKVPVRMSVMRGVALDAVKTIDRGEIRTVAEVLRREGMVPSPRRVASWCNGERKLLTNTSSRGTVEEAEAYYLANRKAIDFVNANLPDNPPFKAAMIGVSLVFAYKKSPSVVESFVVRMVSGTDLEGDSPVFVARELVITSVGKAHQPRLLALKLLRTIQAEIRGEKVKRSHVYATEPTLHYFQGRGK